METKSRTWLKALTWQLLGLLVMTAINLWYLDDWASSLGLSLILATSGIMMFYVHERLWARIRWGFGRLDNDDGRQLLKSDGANDKLSRVRQPESAPQQK